VTGGAVGELCPGRETAGLLVRPLPPVRQAQAVWAV